MFHSSAVIRTLSSPVYLYLERGGKRRKRLETIPVRFEESYEAEIKQSQE